MAAAHGLNSLQCLSLSLLCLFSATLQVTSVASQSSLVTDFADTAEVAPTIAPKCDQTFVSRGGSGNGTFHAPEIINPTNQSRQCLYTFVAAPGQRVLITFRTFDLRGMPPDGFAVGELPACMHESMDIYSEVVSLEAGELVNSPFGGRFCGPIPPRQRVSLHRVVALVFYSDKPFTLPTLFTGTYHFINDSEFEIGTPVPNTPCSFTIHANKKKQGFLLSPTYPGTYPKDMTCNYQFVGQPGQRIRLEFRDFDLFFGGPHCPFDWVRVHDGPESTSPIIGTYCGQQRNLVLYSSNNQLLVTFYTLPRSANSQNRGFKGIFEFSESFVKLDFISKVDAEHMRGSECDQKILSRKESTGFVFSPNYPFPYIPKVVCRYFIYGMQDVQNLERVRLEFLKFAIPKGENAKNDSCSDGYLKVYLKGQEATDSYDKFDYELCGENTPQPLMSEGPRLVIVFSSGELQGPGFKAKYSFETEYRVPGTVAPDGGCSFIYRSEARKRGEFNSPRFPNNYPSNINCTYVLEASQDEQVTLVFDYFKLRADSWNATAGTYIGATCTEDYLDAWWEGGGAGGERQVMLGRWCGVATPGPMLMPRTARAIRLVMHTDERGAASGFKARYVFEPAKSLFGDCGSNMSGSEWGVFTSPGYPANYEPPGRNTGVTSRLCNYFITVRPGKRVLLNFDVFAIEGHLTDRGCSATVVRLWFESSGPPIELCGEKSASDKWHYLSSSNAIRVTFLISDKSVGSRGWHAVWSEVSAPGPGGACGAGGTCLGACLPRYAACTQLRHCADTPPDQTDYQCDESGGEQSSGGGGGSGAGESRWAWWAGGAALAAAVLVALCVGGRRRRRRKRRGPPPPPRPPPRPRPRPQPPPSPPEPCAAAARLALTHHSHNL